MSDTASQLKDLKNIGPVMVEKLTKAGITSPAQLKQMGAKEAYLAMFESGQFCGTVHVAYLYALEGATTDTDWLAISEDKKQELKDFCQELRESLGRK